MKNIKLLLASTAILSMGAFGAKAVIVGSAGADMQSTIHAKVAMINALEIEETKILDFGGIINPQGNEVVVVKSDGTLGAATTANVLTSSYRQPLEGDQIPERGISNGQITIKGGYLDELNGTSIPSATETYTFTFPESIVLKDREGAITCGVVNQIKNDSSNVSSSTTINYGGTLTVDSSIKDYLTADSTLDCEGKGTVTVVYFYDNTN